MSTTSVPITAIDGGSVQLDAARLSALADDLEGSVAHAGDEGYEQAVSIWNGAITRRPAVVARAASVDDVVRTVRFAAEHGIELSIRGGGHNIAGLALTDGGLTLDMSGRNAVEVDKEARLARVQAGRPARRRRPRNAGARPRDHARLRLAHRRRRADAGWRLRVPDPPLRLDRRRPGRWWSSSWPMDRSRARRVTRTPSCSGRCGAGAATSGS